MSMHRTGFTLFLLILHTGCTIHQLKIDGASAVRHSNPVQAERKVFQIERSIPKISENYTKEQLLKSYDSDKLPIFLNSGCCITIDSKAGYTLKYSADVKDDMPFPVAPLLFLVTAGIFPVIETADASVRFQIVENSTDRIVKEYRYHTHQRFFTSWLSIPARLFLWGDQWDLTMFNEHTYPQEMLVNKFEKDFFSDLSAGRIKFQTEPAGRIQVGKGRYAILPVTFRHPRDRETADVIRDKVETVLVNKKYLVLERTRIREIAKEIRLSQEGMTRSDQIQIGKMLNANNLVLTDILELNKEDSSLEFSVKNIDIESGQIIWKYEFTIDERRISESINRAMDELETKIP